ncbi:16S rRNA (guanine(527)-N(7))-methyltransferase RsmG [Carnobacteriaceae bacterium zg-ZUI240]|nr:16S rRNA (guanine(527)-N(7))-methyltransferase RsmG [Carnobacteriaceae bacterium zg-ZUI240]
MTPEQFKNSVEEAGITLTDKQLKQYEMYFEMLVEWNEKMNLTAITQKEEVYLKHFYDSLTLAIETDVLQKSVTLCDVGAGAGFPSIPLKIALPHLHVTIVDSLNKRITFLNELVRTLELENVSCFHDRAETFGQNEAFREKFDVVTARAVARLNLLSELCLPLVKVDGVFVSMKASSTLEEVAQSRKAFNVLGGEFVEDKAFQLPYEAGERHIVVVHKKQATPKKYPRKAGLPAKSPIE